MGILQILKIGTGESSSGDKNGENTNKNKNKNKKFGVIHIITYAVPMTSGKTKVIYRFIRDHLLLPTWCRWPREWMEHLKIMRVLDSDTIFLHQQERERERRMKAMASNSFSSSLSASSSSSSPSVMQATRSKDGSIKLVDTSGQVSPTTT